MVTLFTTQWQTPQSFPLYLLPSSDLSAAVQWASHNDTVVAAMRGKWADNSSGSGKGGGVGVGEDMDGGPWEQKVEAWPLSLIDDRAAAHSLLPCQREGIHNCFSQHKS